ncbi:hypothetical protein PYEL_38290 [Pseudomonas sp. URMO17WK12:I11]|nr:hypothetical protein PYEL_38290 [Pseudomonas sp. URMO17WK12:I11]
MRGFGIFAMIVGLIAVIGALAMDVSVSTGMGGRVNNIGLIAQQQNYLIIGALIALAGLLMTIFGGKKQLSSEQSQSLPEAEDSRPCPFCAEPIKHAAIKCKHCAADVEAVERPPLLTGWVVSIACRPGLEYDRTRATALREGLPLAQSEGSVVVIGPYAHRAEASSALKSLQAKHSLFGEIKHKA